MGMQPGQSLTTTKYYLKRSMEVKSFYVKCVLYYNDIPCNEIYLIIAVIACPFFPFHPQITLEGPVKFLCNIFQVTEESGKNSPAVRNHLLSGSSDGLQFPSTHHEGKPLLNNIPLQNVSLDNQSNCKTSSDGEIFSCSSNDQREIAEFNQKIAFEQVQKCITRLEEYICMKDREERRLKMSRRQWREVAFIMDRSFFIFYIIIIVTSILFLFPRP